MAGNSIGRLDAFNQASDSLTAYVERVQLYFVANGLEKHNKQVAAFRTAVGKGTYQLLRNLVTPELPKNKSFNDIVALLKAHFEPKPLIITEHFHFNRRQQEADESIATYFTELRRQSTHCDFGTILDDALRDRFVCGLWRESTKQNVLSEQERTFQKVLQTAQNNESAAEKTKLLQNQVSTIWRRLGPLML